MCGLSSHESIDANTRPPQAAWYQKDIAYFRVAVYDMRSVVQRNRRRKYSRVVRQVVRPICGHQLQLSLDPRGHQQADRAVTIVQQLRHTDTHSLPPATASLDAALPERMYKCTLASRAAQPTRFLAMQRRRRFWWRRVEK